jgi:hypothetical protein
VYKTARGGQLARLETERTDDLALGVQSECQDQHHQPDHDEEGK